jgi:hypothetical protein
MQGWCLDVTIARVVTTVRTVDGSARIRTPRVIFGRSLAASTAATITEKAS